MEKIESSVKSAKEIVMEYTQATESQDFQSARGYLKDNISYVYLLIRLTALNRTWNIIYTCTRLGSRFDIKKEFADSNDVCIIHEWNSQLVCVVSCRWWWENKFD